ncbi:M23 family metallopeptidase [Brachybacterium sp. GCM10030267]|uniref:M23 family metallopeptidase n=1 Tax=Brachybacterium sp. GCM10030267 TaxID=3273381 RepID=UPI00360FE148
MTPPSARLVLSLPVRGRWLTQNSPANRVPSHGTELFALAHSIDLVPVGARDRTAPVTVMSLLRPQAPAEFPGFGRPVLAPLAGTVHAIRDAAEDHAAHRGIPSIGYALTQARRAAGGWPALAGNHVILRAERPGPAVFVALCHLRRGSVTVRPGQTVGAGEQIGRCGNSGNSTEPHLHLQAMDAADPSAAGPVPFSFPPAVCPAGLPRNGEVVDAG